MSIQTGKTHVWEGGIRVPLVIRGPGIAEGTQSHVPAIGYDFLPTIAEWVGASEDLPADIDGGSLAGVLAGDGTGTVERGTDALIWYYGAYRNMKHVGPQAAIRRNNHKLIRSPWVDFSSLRWCVPETPSARTHESLDHSEQAVDSTELGAAKPRMDYQAQ
jgi:arylsulfatase A-like enzyme